jgi:predicted HTH domain antitoxin
MANQDMKNLHIEFELPALLANQAGLSESDVSQQVRRMLALFLYEHKRLSLGKACEIGNMSYWEFADWNRQLGIPFHYSQDDLAEDMIRLSNA